MAYEWYKCGMTRTRISTTVDQALLQAAREVHAGLPDSALIDAALGALVARNRSAEIDASYAAYDVTPLATEDEWGDLASFRRAADES